MSSGSDPRPHRASTPPETTAMVVLSALFFLRVLGQALVARRPRAWLPPMEQWQSGILPYPVLLVSQGAILTVQTAIEVQSRSGRGVFVRPRRRLGRAIHRLSLVYLMAMIVRYVVSMRRYPERRWFGKTIPILFHCVLATYLHLYARILARPRGA